MAVFVGLLLAVPLCRRELFPFTSAGLFVDGSRTMCRYEVMDDAGRQVPLEGLGLQRNYQGLAGYSKAVPGRHPGARLDAPTIDRFGEVAPLADVLATVTAHMARGAYPGRLYVTQIVYGDVDGELGEVARHRLCVANPRGGAPCP